MGTEEGSGNMNRIAKQLETGAPGWEKTKSGKVYTQLQGMASRNGKEGTVLNRDGAVESFVFNGQTARIRKSFEGGTVGSQDGQVRSFIEGYDYKRMPWWKEAVDASKCAFDILDTPLMLAAKDAGVADYEETFRASRIMEKYGVPPTDTTQRKYIEDFIVMVIGESLGSHYDIKDFMGGLRLMAKTAEAERSRVEDNEVYREALKRIADVTPSIKEGLASYFGRDKEQAD